MKKILIGYKQGDNNYAYLSNISKKSVNVTTIMEEAIEFSNKDLSQSICDYLNDKDKEHRYITLEINVEIKER